MRDAEVEAADVIADVAERAAAANAPVSDELLGYRLVPEQMKILKVHRYQDSVDQALMESPELEQCLKNLANAGVNAGLPCGAKFFGRPDQYKPALRAINSAQYQLKF